MLGAMRRRLLEVLRDWAVYNPGERMATALAVDVETTDYYARKILRTILRRGRSVVIWSVWWMGMTIAVVVFSVNWTIQPEAAAWLRGCMVVMSLGWAVAAIRLRWRQQRRQEREPYWRW